LRAVIDPELGDTIVDLGMVRSIDVVTGATSSSMSP
jgi:metal-sulfur cluster biosynthetic enzyme